MTSRPFLAVVHYDGGGFAGWQRQPAARTVQGEFEAVLQRLSGGERRVGVTGAGRTDAGVHALGQGVGFTASERWVADPGEVRRALNALLPREIWVERVYVMCPGFNARRSATARRYRYVIGTDEAAASPFRRPYEWAVTTSGARRAVDVAALETAAAALVGEHDFRGLAAAGATPDGAHYRCRVALARWAPRTDSAGVTGVTFTIEADRFLHHMVRFIVGTMVDIALGRRPPEDFSRLLVAHDNLAASPPAPPHGLYLEAVRYPADLYADGGASTP